MRNAWLAPSADREHRDPPRLPLRAGALLAGPAPPPACLNHARPTRTVLPVGNNRRGHDQVPGNRRNGLASDLKPHSYPEGLPPSSRPGPPSERPRSRRHRHRHRQELTADVNSLRPVPRVRRRDYARAAPCAIQFYMAAYGRARRDSYQDQRRRISPGRQRTARTFLTARTRRRSSCQERESYLGWPQTDKIAMIKERAGKSWPYGNNRPRRILDYRTQQKYSPKS